MRPRARAAIFAALIACAASGARADALADMTAERAALAAEGETLTAVSQELRQRQAEIAADEARLTAWLARIEATARALAARRPSDSALCNATVAPADYAASKARCDDAVAAFNREVAAQNGERERYRADEAALHERAAALNDDVLALNARRDAVDARIAVLDQSLAAEQAKADASARARPQAPTVIGGADCETRGGANCPPRIGAAEIAEAVAAARNYLAQAVEARPPIDSARLRRVHAELERLAADAVRAGRIADRREAEAQAQAVMAAAEASERQGRDAAAQALLAQARAAEAQAQSCRDYQAAAAHYYEASRRFETDAPAQMNAARERALVIVQTIDIADHAGGCTDVRAAMRAALRARAAGGG